MKITQIIEGIRVFEANVANQIKDPKTAKLIYIAMTHDGTLPGAKLAKLGPKPTPEQTLQLWSDLLDESLSNTRYGNISVIRNSQGKVIEDGPFDIWLTKLYMNGQANFEDINGEGGDALGAWYVLKSKNKLKPNQNQLQNLKSIKAIQNIVNKREYRDELKKIEDAEVIEKHKRERKEIVLVDNQRFLVVMPMNYGACYTFNNSAGYQANFCTGSSSGLRWFQNYAPDGPVISVTDKTKIDQAEGKWQLHAQTRQIVDADQTRRHDTNWNDERFSRLFPGLMKAIGDSMLAKAEEIKEASKEITNGKGYDVAKDVSDLQKTYPLSWASKLDTWIVTHKASGKSARIEAEDLADVKHKLLTRHPNVNLEDFTFKLEQEEPAQDN